MVPMVPDSVYEQRRSLTRPSGACCRGPADPFVPARRPSRWTEIWKLMELLEIQEAATETVYWQP